MKMNGLKNGFGQPVDSKGYDFSSSSSYSGPQGLGGRKAGASSHTPNAVIYEGKCIRKYRKVKGKFSDVG
jgi:hypothetical protein